MADTRRITHVCAVEDATARRATATGEPCEIENVTDEGFNLLFRVPGDDKARVLPAKWEDDPRLIPGTRWTPIYEGTEGRALAKIGTILLAALAGAVGGAIWALKDMPLYWCGFEIDDEDDFAFGFGFNHPAMQAEYARVWQFFGGEPIDPAIDFNRSKKAGRLFHHLKGAWCTWVGLSRERGGKTLASSLLLNAVLGLALVWAWL